jgi:phage-related protein
VIQTDPIVVLYAIDIPSSPPSKLRVTPYPEAVLFERDSLNASITYSPFSIGHESVRADTEGSLPTVRMTMQNLTRESVALMDEYSGLEGQKVRIVYARRSELPDGVPLRDEEYDVLSSVASETTAEFTLGHATLVSRKFPDLIISRTHCAHDYGGPGCGYDTTIFGALQTCDFTETGANGCTVHGDKEVLAGFARRHPARMKLFPGVPRVGGVG